jgi:cis-L-3-hydroxyproline dehydratase
MAEEARDLAEQGLAFFQLKLGDDPVGDAARVSAIYEAISDQARFITCDGNTGWSPAQAQRFLAQISHMDVFFEQPCKRLTDLAELRRLSPRPVIADESIRSVVDLLDCLRLGAADAINIKPARVGGLTRAAQLRDVAEAAGIMIMVDEPMGSGISAAAVGQLAVSSDPQSLLCASNSTMMVTESLLADGGVRLEGFFGNPAQKPGLGIEVDKSALGEPLFAVAA